MVFSVLGGMIKLFWYGVMTVLGPVGVMIVTGPTTISGVLMVCVMLNGVVMFTYFADRRGTNHGVCVEVVVVL